MAHRSPLYFKGAQDAQMIPCGTILDCQGNPIFSKLTRTSITSGASYTQLSTDFYIGINRAAAFTLNLLAAASWANRYIIVKDESGKAGTYNITIDPSGAETVDGDSTYKITINYQSVTLYSDGTTIYII